MGQQDTDKAAPAATKEPAAGANRRGVLRAVFGTFLGWGFAALGATTGLWAAASTRFMFPNAILQRPDRFKIGYPSDFPRDRVATGLKEKFGVWVVHGKYQGSEQIFALRTVCTHLGCITLWQENERKFKCPCHGSGFYIDGVNFEGPAPRPLERFAIHLADDGQLEIDKSKIFREELGQWDDPECFVVV